VCPPDKRDLEAFVYQFDFPRTLKGLEPWATSHKSSGDVLIPRWSRPGMINAVVVGQTNPYYRVANLSYVRSISIDKWA
jgi:hypothetical protein